MGASRGRWTSIGFMVVWLTFWTSGILVAIWHLGAEALSGEPEAVVFLAIWLAAAGFALRNGCIRLKQLLFDEKTPPRPVRHHDWHDDMDAPPSVPSGESSIRARRDSAAGR